MPGTEYLSGNSLVAYPFKEGRAINTPFNIDDDVFLDALFVIYNSSITRPYISKLTTIQNNIGIEFSDVVTGVLGTVTIPFYSAVSHLENKETGFFSYEGPGWSIKLLFGEGIIKLTTPGINVNFTPKQTELSQAAVVHSVEMVTSLNFESYLPGNYYPSIVHVYSAGDSILLDNGTNTDFNFKSPDTMYLDIKRGNGSGLHDPCDNGDIENILTIDNISPDSSGSIFISPDSCYSFKLLTYNDTQLYSYLPDIQANYGDFKTPVPSSGSQAGHINHFNAIDPNMGGHGLVIQNNCKPKCPPQNLNAFAEYLNRVTDAASELYKIINNPTQTFGIGTITGNKFTATTFCSGNLPTGWAEGVCSDGKFVKYYHEGRNLSVRYSSNTTHTFTILEVIDDHNILLFETPPAGGGELVFKVSDFGIKNKLNDIIVANNLKGETKNIPYITTNYSTVEAYNAAQAYGTFITTAVAVYNPGSNPLAFSVNWSISSAVSLIPSSVKVKDSQGTINYGGTSGVVACKDYATFEAIFFIPCSQDVNSPNEGAVTLHVIDSVSGTDIDNSPKIISVIAASCVSATTAVKYINAYQNRPFSYTIEDINGTGYYMSGDIPTWLTLDGHTGVLSGLPTGLVSKAYTITIVVVENGGGEATQIITIDYIAIPVITFPTGASSFTVYPPDTLNRTYTKSAPLLPVIASNSPISYTFTNIPPGLKQEGRGLTGKITLGNSPDFPITYNISITATNEAGTSAPTVVALVITNQPIITAPAYQNTPFCYPITTDSYVTSQTVATTLPSWLSFDPTIPASCSFYGTNTSPAPVTEVIVIRQNLTGGTYRLVEYTIPYVSTPLITYPVTGSSFSIYPPDVNNLNGPNTVFTEAHPFLKVLATNYPSSFSANGLPDGLSIDNYGNIIGQITLTQGTFNVLVTATNQVGTSSSVSFSMRLNSGVPIINAYQGQSLCYKFSTLISASSFSVSGDVPAWVSVSRTTSTSCHISSDLPLADSVSRTYNIVLNYVTANANLSQSYVINYIALPQISSPVSGQAFNIPYENGLTPVYTDNSPLLTMAVSNNPSSYSTSRPLPAGLTLTQSGKIIGQTTASLGSYALFLIATNDAGSVNIPITINIYSVAATDDRGSFYIYPPDFNYNTSTGTLFTSAHPLLVVPTNNNATDFAATGLPSGLSIDNHGNIIGQITDNPGVYSVSIVATSNLGSIQNILYSFVISNQIVEIIIRQGQQLCYKFPNLTKATSFSVTGALPNWITKQLNLLASCHLSASAQSSNVSISYPITLTTHIYGGTLTQNLLVKYLTPPVISYPHNKDIFKIFSNNYKDIVYDAENPLFTVVASNQATSFSAAGLPSGLSIDNNGNVVGQITGDIGNYTISLSAINEAGISSVSAAINISASPVKITAYKNTAVCYNISSLGNADNYIYVGDVPSWLTFNWTNGASCVLSGTPTDITGKVYNFTLQATNSVGTITTAFEVTYLVAPTITYPSEGAVFKVTLPDFGNRLFTVGSPLFKIAASNYPTKFAGSGFLNNTFKVDSLTGAVVGSTKTATANGNIPISLTASNPAGTSDPVTVYLSMTASSLVENINATSNKTICIALDTSDNPTNITASGLPSWLSLNYPAVGGCHISGIIPQDINFSKVYNIVLTRYYNEGNINQALTINVNFPPIITYPPAGRSYSISPPDYGYRVYSPAAPLISVTAQNAPTNYRAEGLPEGLTINTKGQIVGGPVISPSGTYSVNLYASNASIGEESTPTSINIVVNSSAGTPIKAVQGQAICQVITTQDGATNYVIAGGILPSGVSFNGSVSAQCNFGGTPGNTNIPGNYALDVRSVYPGGSSISEIDFTFIAPPKITNTQKTFAVLPSVYSVTTYTDSHSFVPLTYQNNPTAFTATGLPSGLEISCYGNIIGHIDVSAAGVYKVTITATNEAGASSPYSFTLDLSKQSVVLTWPNPAAIIYGALLTDTQLNASAANANNIPLAGTFTYTPPIGTKLAGGRKTLFVQFNPTNTTDYISTSKSVVITVSPQTPTINWSSPSNIVYGTALSSTQLNPSISGANGELVEGSFNFSPAAGTILNAGTYTLNAVFAPKVTANFRSVSASVQIVVNPANYSIVWNNPKNITYGTPLGTTQLNARAVSELSNASISVPVTGTYTYTPDVGIVLAAGTHTLSTTFTPASPQNYTSPSYTTSATIVVNPITPVMQWTPITNSIVYGNPLTEAQLNAKVYDPLNTGQILLNAGNISYSYGVLNVGSNTITATFNSSNPNYTSASISTTINVKPAPTALSWVPAPEIVYGDTLNSLELNATADNPGTFSYNPKAGTVMEGGFRKIKVNFKPDSNNYLPAADEKVVHVLPHDVNIIYTDKTIVYGNSLNYLVLNAYAVKANTTAGSGSGPIDLSLHIPGVFTYKLNGATITTNTPPPKVGNYTITAHFVPNKPADFNPATVSIKLTVNKATPKLFWRCSASRVDTLTTMKEHVLNATAVGYNGKTGLKGSVVYTYNVTAENAYHYNTYAAHDGEPDICKQAGGVFVYGEGNPQRTPTNTGRLPVGSEGTINYGSYLEAATYDITATFSPDTNDEESKNYDTGTMVRSFVVKVANIKGYFNFQPSDPVVFGTLLGAPHPEEFHVTGIKTDYDIMTKKIVKSSVNICGCKYMYPNPADPVTGQVCNKKIPKFQPQPVYSGGYFIAYDYYNYYRADASLKWRLATCKPRIVWGTPQPVPKGYVLDTSNNLNAKVYSCAGEEITDAGTLVYSPPPGTAMSEKINILKVTWTPTKDLSDICAFSVAKYAVAISLQKPPKKNPPGGYEI